MDKSSKPQLIRQSINHNNVSTWWSVDCIFTFIVMQHQRVQVAKYTRVAAHVDKCYMATQYRVPKTVVANASVAIACISAVVMAIVAILMVLHLKIYHMHKSAKKFNRYEIEFYTERIMLISLLDIFVCKFAG